MFSCVGGVQVSPGSYAWGNVGCGGGDLLGRWSSCVSRLVSGFVGFPLGSFSARCLICRFSVEVSIPSGGLLFGIIILSVAMCLGTSFAPIQAPPPVLAQAPDRL